MPLWNNIAELMDYYIPPRPSVYWIDITRECNLRCIMCPQSKGLTSRPAKMPIELFKNIIDDVGADHPLIKLYMSGEPLLHECLFDMIAYAAVAGCRTMLHTNAVALTADVCERILASPLGALSFSFDGCTPEVYERLRPPARFAQVESNIRQYLGMRQRRGRGPHTTIEIIRMRETDHLLHDFTEVWRTSGVDDIHIVDFLTWHGLVEDRRAVGRTGAPAYSPCAAPFRHGCILSDGTVVPCCLDINGRLPLGNVTGRRFREIWAGNDYRRFRLQMLTASFPRGCICECCDNTCREA